MTGFSPGQWTHAELQLSMFLVEYLNRVFTPRFLICARANPFFSDCCARILRILCQSSQKLAPEWDPSAQLGILPQIPGTGTACPGKGQALWCLLGVQRVCTAHRALRGFCPMGYQQQLAGRGKKSPAQKKPNTSSSLKLNNAQNWELENTSLSFVTQAEQSSLIFIQICNSMCSRIYLIICYCQILSGENTVFDLFLEFLG